jgi:hypothetical protein
MVTARFGLKTNLTSWDITAIRFAVAGLVLLPFLLKKGFALDRLGSAGLVAILLGGGAPMVLISYLGLQFAPAVHGSSLFTALIPLNVAILASFVLAEAFTVADAATATQAAAERVLQQTTQAASDAAGKGAEFASKALDATLGVASATQAAAERMLAQGAQAASDAAGKTADFASKALDATKDAAKKAELAANQAADPANKKAT